MGSSPCRSSGRTLRSPGHRPKRSARDPEAGGAVRPLRPGLGPAPASITEQPVSWVRLTTLGNPRMHAGRRAGELTAWSRPAPGGLGGERRRRRRPRVGRPQSNASSRYRAQPPGVERCPRSSLHTRTIREVPGGSGSSSAGGAVDGDDQRCLAASAHPRSRGPWNPTDSPWRRGAQRRVRPNACVCIRPSAQPGRRRIPHRETGFRALRTNGRATFPVRTGLISARLK